jgi:hypothetical protein
MEEKTGARTVYSQAPGARPKRKSLFLGILVVVVVLLAIGTGYLLFIKNIQSTFMPGGEANVEWVDYQNPNGFKVSYPKNLELSEKPEGVDLAGDGGLSFVVGRMEGKPLLAKLGGVEESPRTFTVDARTGYLVTKEGVDYYYFPLFGDYYLEVIDRGGEEALSGEIISKLKFEPPTAVN